MRSPYWFCLVVCATSLAATLPGAAADNAKGVSIESRADRLVVNLDGEPFTEYVFTNTSRPFCYPIYGPGQVAMTRNWPMKEVAGEQRDHPHHKGMWYSHGAVNGIDFWSEAAKAGTIRHKRFLAITPGPDAGIVRAENEWVAKDGKIVCTDQRTLVFRKDSANRRIIDFQITIHASQGPLTFGDTKEGTMAIRIAESMRLKGGEGKGRIVNSRDDRDDKTWGRQAEWCAYFGPAGGRTMGILVVDAPSNPRHPTWWHVRDYGLFAANPFGKHDFMSLKDAGAGELKLEEGSSVTFKYTFYFFEGSEPVVKEIVGSGFGK